MSATRYRQFLKLCEQWPRDETKKGRDLGMFLRQRVASAFREGENTQISDPEKCDQMYESLARINSNIYRQRFPRVRDTSFTGVTVEECRLILSGMDPQYHIPVTSPGCTRPLTQCQMGLAPAPNDLR
uniref:ubiquinol-cytochrome-c reductase complex assembly factor 2 isoform X1 n=1 Tax=Monopterus albus TaxID=43700 RepID=UPI0009B3B3D2|nr:ubiquinol-cytochrome-c reductase complex assembly factor 2 isoform X1 [Monopterus albus]